MEEIYHVADFESKFNDVVKRFTTAGWTQIAPEVFSITNTGGTIEAHVHIGDDVLMIDLADKSEHASEVRIDYGDKLDAAIDALLQHQDTLDIANTDAFVAEIRTNFPDTLEFADR